jgi:hypothetical protein
VTWDVGREVLALIYDIWRERLSRTTEGRRLLYVWPKNFQPSQYGLPETGLRPSEPLVLSQRYSLRMAETGCSPSVLCLAEAGNDVFCSAGSGGVAPLILNVDGKWRWWWVSCFDRFTAGKESLYWLVTRCTTETVWTFCPRIVQPIEWSLYWLSYSGLVGASRSFGTTFCLHLYFYPGSEGTVIRQDICTHQLAQNITIHDTCLPPYKRHIVSDPHFHQNSKLFAK